MMQSMIRQPYARAPHGNTSRYRAQRPPSAYGQVTTSKYASPKPGAVWAQPSSDVRPYVQDFVAPMFHPGEMPATAQQSSQYLPPAETACEAEYAGGGFPSPSLFSNDPRSIAHQVNPLRVAHSADVQHDQLSDTLPRIKFEQSDDLLEVPTALSQVCREREFDTRKRKRRSSHSMQSLPGQRQASARVHVRSGSFPVGSENICYYNFTGDAIPQIPKLSVPEDPVRLQSALKLLKPTILFAKYDCEDCCRSRGICVHFSLLLGCRKVPDGLICPTCCQVGVEKGYDARRICPMHNKPTLSQYTANLPEDILASATQQAAGDEILERSWNCRWEGVMPRCIQSLDHGTTLQDPTYMNDWEFALPSTEITSMQNSPPFKRAKACDRVSDANYELYENENLRGQEAYEAVELGVECDYDRGQDRGYSQFTRAARPESLLDGADADFKDSRFDMSTW